MIWAILALLGVPLWLCAIAILLLVFRNRGLRKRAADIPMRLRLDANGRWHRGHGLWIHDVLGFRGSPAAWDEALLWAADGAPRELTSEEAHKFRRLDQPAAATFTAVDGPAFEAVTTRSHLALLLGPFQQAGPSEQGDPKQDRPGPEPAGHPGGAQTTRSTTPGTRASGGRVFNPIGAMPPRPGTR